MATKPTVPVPVPELSDRLTYDGTKIVLPNDPKRMTISDAIQTLVDIQEDQESDVEIDETINAYPWDGARAFMTAVKMLFGFAKGVNSFFTRTQMISIQTDFNQTEQVLWGRFSLPNFDGTVSTSSTTGPDGQMMFRITASTVKREAHRIKQLAQLTRDIVAKDSIYRGKALRFVAKYDPRTETRIVQPPQFIDLSRVNPSELIFSDDIHEQIDTAFFTPLRKRELAASVGIPFKRGICFLGEYGVGKTLAIYVGSLIAREHGIMFLMVDDPADLPLALVFARQYGPAVVACEDIDRAVADRDDLCNTIMDALDGVESKDRDVMVVFTSNEPDDIHAAMRRPGRIDTFIRIDAPDAHAVDRLLRLYSRGLIAGDMDIAAVSRMLAGQIPARVREVIELAKLAAVRRAETLDDARMLTVGDLMNGARRMLAQLELFAPPVVDDPNLRQLARFGADLVTDISRAANRIANEKHAREFAN